ncbi:MAG: DUF3368 domain-containing protein, partial [Cellvibrionaceae bacterium]|nr:DUF3368 domain-containing protein [Cellvibrionaceae bacterium]
LDSRLENLSKVLDLGEAEAIALAEQLGAIVLIDERRGRSVAKQRNIPITGTAAILIKAKQAGEVAQVKPLLDTLDKVGYRLSPALINEVLKIIGEN